MRRIPFSKLLILNLQKEEYAVRELYADEFEEAIAAWFPTGLRRQWRDKWIEVACLEADIEKMLELFYVPEHLRQDRQNHQSYREGDEPDHLVLYQPSKRR